MGDYLALIPLPVGMKLNAATLLGSTERIEAQQTCLRQLEIGFSLVEQLRSQLLQAAPAESDRAWWIDWGVSPASPPGASKVGLPKPGER
ncbi:hypothetical protein [Lusitaniella coriacea]|uniref:hypothetical protein n=1 Tax=Lusitaniella coriacea TaxID=1983105 RepID=UPI003CF889D0